MQQAYVEIDIGPGKSQKLSGSQSGQVQEAQGSAQNCVPNRRCPSFHQLGASLQEAFALFSAEHARHKSLTHNPQGPAIRYDCARVFEAQKTTDLSDQSQTMRARRLRFGAPSGYIVMHNLERDQRIIWQQASTEKAIQLAQRATLLSIAVAHGVLLSEELYEF